MPQFKEKIVSLLQLIVYETGSIGMRICVPLLRKFFPQKKSIRLEELTSRRLLSQTASICNASETVEFQKVKSTDENIVATFLTSEKYTVGTELQVDFSETFECDQENETIKTTWSGTVTRIQLQKKHETYLIEIQLNACISE